MQTNYLKTLKTHFNTFTLKRKYCVQQIYLFINDIHIKRVTSTKCLGIIIDVKCACGHIKNKICIGIGILCQTRHFFNYNTILTLYYSFIFPYLLYSIEIWGSINIKLFQSVFKRQNNSLSQF